MLKNIDNLQYKCLIILNYETACRINEIRHIRIEDITQYEQYANVFLGVSKTQQRNLPIIQSGPYINQWLNNHPLKQNKKAYLFIANYRGSYQQYFKSGLYLVIKKCGKCLNKNIYPQIDCSINHKTYLSAGDYIFFSLDGDEFGLMNAPSTEPLISGYPLLLLGVIALLSIIIISKKLFT